jgi:hypothetical protein
VERLIAEVMPQLAESDSDQGEEPQ